MSDLNITAWCNRIIFNKDNFNIALFKDLKTNITYTIKGDMSVAIGNKYKITASLDDNPKYPDTYKIESCRYDIDLTTANEKQLEKFFSTILGKGIAKELSNTPDIIKMLNEDDKASLLSIKGVGEATYETISKAYMGQKDMSMAYIYFKDYEFTKSMIDSICFYYRSPDRAIETAKKNPYLLINVPKLGFKKVDSAILLMNKNTKTPINHKQRFMAYIDFLFTEEYAKGNTWVSPKELIDQVIDFVPGVKVDDVIDYINNSEKFYSIDNENAQFGKIGKRITSKSNLILEMKIAKELRRIAVDESRLDIKNADMVIKEMEERQGWQYADEQKKAIDTILNNNVCIVQGTAGSGKAQPIDTLIPTPNGFKKLGNIKKGDKVFNRLGKPTYVTGVYPQGMMDNYEVTLSDGRKTYCNDEHIWTVFTSKGNFINKTLREIIDNGFICHDKRGRRCLKYRIPTNEAVYYDEKQYRIDPYIVGVMIGDGACTLDRLTICSNDEDVVREVSRLLPYDNEYIKLHPKNFNWSFKLKEPINGRSWLYTEEALDSVKDIMCLAGKKKIPNEYKYGSIDQRYSLIQGLFDTDGSISYAGGRYNIKYSTTSKELVNDIQNVLWSLGIESNIGTRVRKDKKNIEYDLQVNMPNDDKHRIFRNTHKKKMSLECIGKYKRRKYDRISIYDIKKMPEQKEMVCIMVNDPEHLYLTNDYIVTHNTSTVNAYTNILKYNHYLFSQCALSGKAANNLTRVTGAHGSTIHSLIGYKTDKQYNKSHPLPVDVVILDEISMVEDRIFLALLEAIPEGGKLIMLGDAGQLDSIGVGVLNGMMRSKAIPSITLKHIHRQAEKSAIITHSLAFRQGKLPSELKLKTYSEKVYGDNQDLKYILVKKDEEDEISRLAMFEYKRLIAEYGVDNVSIICSTKKTGTTSTQKLNAYAQIIANPEKINKKEIKIGKNNNLYVLREGDKVINSKNNYNTKNVYGYPTPIYNGNTGTLLSINNDGSLTIDFDGIDKVLVEGSSVKNIELGYATTIHRVQGSTIKAVIFALPFHFLLNSRELVYTGSTRASDYQTIITSPRSIREALKKTSKREEKTNLDIFIRELNIWQEKLGIRV